MQKHRWIILLIVIVTLSILGLIKFSPPNAYGYIEILTSDVDITIKRNVFFTQSVALNSDTTTKPIKTGTYRPSVIVLRKNQDNIPWSILSYGPFGDLSNIVVEQEKTTQVSLGEPLTIKADISHYRNDVSIDYIIQGQSGEQYRSIFKDGKTLPLPKLQIIDEHDNTLAVGQFEYG